MKNIYLILAAILVFSISSCTSYKKTVYLKDAQNNTEYQLFDNADSYKLRIGDVLYVEINSLNENINTTFNIKNSTTTTYNDQFLFLRSYSINNNGFIVLPIVGEIKVNGLSISEARAEIQRNVNNYLNDATTIVKLVSYKISVLGEVKSPGHYSVFQNKLNLFEGLSLAGNITDYGNIKNILLIRTNANKSTTYRLDLTDQNVIASEQYMLQPNDIIYVEPVKAKVFRQNAPNLSVVLSTITTLVLVLNFILK